MIEKKITIKLKYGLHARPSSYIVVKLTPLKLDKAIITHKNKTAQLKSILDLLTLFVEENSEVTVAFSGVDEEVALKIVEDILNEKENDSIYNT
jgi:phosphocarrier protein